MLPGISFCIRLSTTCTHAASEFETKRNRNYTTDSSSSRTVIGIHCKRKSRAKKKSIYIFVAGAALRETIDLSCADRSGDNVRVEERRERKKEAHANHTSSPNLVRATAIKRSTLRLRPPFSCVKFSDDY